MAATRTLVVRELSTLSTGTSKHGAPWTLYAAKVADAEGRLLDERFRSFEALPLDRPLQLEVDRRDDPQHGVSFTLKSPRKGGALRHRIETLEGEVKRLSERLTALEVKR
jgi:hypothetical protein